MPFVHINASSQLVISVRGTFVESPNARKVMRVGMVNQFQLNGMETQGFPSLALFHGTGPTVEKYSSCQAQAKGAFDMLMHCETKQL